MAHSKQGQKNNTLFVLDIMQVTFVTLPAIKSMMDLPTASFNSQGMGTQAKMGNVTKHMPTQFQLQVSSQQMGRAQHSAWLERQGHPCMKSSQFVSVCPRICTIQFPSYRMQSLTQIDHKVLKWKGSCNLDAIDIRMSRT